MSEYRAEIVAVGVALWIVGIIGIVIVVSGLNPFAPNATVVDLYDGQCIDLDKKPIECTNSKHEIQVIEPICIIKADNGEQRGKKCDEPIGGRIYIYTNETKIMAIRSLVGVVMVMLGFIGGAITVGFWHK